VKRRKFVTAGAFIAALLAAALAAASVGSAATAKTSATVLPKQKVTKSTWSKQKGNVETKTGRVAYHEASQFVPLGAPVQPNKAQILKAGKIAGAANRPTRHLQPGVKAPGQAAAAPGITGANIPHIHSLPVTNGSGVTTAYGLSDYWQEATHTGVFFHDGGGVTPPDQALAVSGSQTLEVVNDVLMVMDQNFNHGLAAEPLEGLFAPAILATGYGTVSDPRAIYDASTGRFFITVVAYGPPGFGPGGSAVFIAVSNTSDAQGTYNIYVLDTSFDGAVCTADGCLADQPNLGADRYTLDISTNSFDWDLGNFNGAQLYVIDKTALAGGFLFPAIGYLDVGQFFAYPGFANNTCGSFNPGLSAGFCLASIQPAATPNQSYASDHGGTEFMLESLDPLGSVDNRIVDWALTNTSAISSFFNGPFLSGVVVSTEDYGYPLTDHCQVMPQMSAWSQFFGVPISSAQCGYAEQPASGQTPFCDWFTFDVTGASGGCEPGAIQANDDRMSPVTSVKSGNSPAQVWGGLNTDALVADPIGGLHRRDAVAWFSVSATSWDGSGFGLTSAAVNGQGYLGNWQNDVLYPSVAVVSTNSSSAMIGFTITGNNTNPSTGAAKFTVHTAPTKLPITVQGKDVLDDFCNETPICGFFSGDPNTLYRPRFGDYSAAASWGGDLYTAGEVAGGSCDDTAFFDINFGVPCGNPPRGYYSNWSTGLTKGHSS